jgi:hypothetical protein
MKKAEAGEIIMRGPHYVVCPVCKGYGHDS